MAICAAASLASAVTAADAAVVNSSPEAYVELHNAARAVVAGAGPVSWDGEAARHAAERAAPGCAGTALQRRRSAAGAGDGYGENVFRATATPGMAWDAPPTPCARGRRRLRRSTRRSCGRDPTGSAAPTPSAPANAASSLAAATNLHAGKEVEDFYVVQVS